MKNDELTIRYFYHQNWIGLWVPERTKWKISHGTEHELVLTYIKGAELVTEELIGGKEPRFHKINYKSCRGFYMEEKRRKH